MSSAACFASGQSFSTPEEALDTLAQAAETMNRGELERIFGSESHDLLFTNDPVADENALSRAAQAMKEGRSLQRVDDNKMLVMMGAKKWPFPVPLVRNGNSWVFDLSAGREEILNRRIGENEIKAIRVCRALVAAEKIYALKDRDGDGFTEYAQVIRSSPGRKNGLYWPETEDAESAPLRNLAAEAEAEGYSAELKAERISPYHGYYFKILKAQGPYAPGGKKSYVTQGGRMTEGFAVLAWPADWNISGVMTFMVGQDGVVLEKDIGPGTGKVAGSMREYDPDAGWKPVK